jgi:hypothetical protein
MKRNWCLAVLGGVLLLGAGRLCADGLSASYAGSLPSVYDEGDKFEKLKGKHFKVLKTGVLEGDKDVTITDVVFEENAKCTVVGYGRGEGSDLDLFVTVAKGGKEIGKDTALNNTPIVEWQSGGGDDRKVDIRIRNAGTKACSYVVLANY